MIEAILLRNFQKWESLRVELDPKITVFIGRSDTGKSACVRALRWLMLNKGPTKVQRIGSDRARVSMWVDGHKISRAKSSKANKYTVDGEVFKALKKGGMPVQVESILNVGDINFQRQLDSHYWFSLTPAQISAELNKIVNLSEIDGSIAHSAARVKKVKSKIEVCNERIQELKASNNRLEWIFEFNADLLRIEDRELNNIRRASKIERLALVIKQARKSKKAISNGREARSDAAIIDEKLQAFQDGAAKVERLSGIISQIDRCKSIQKVDIAPVHKLEELIREYDEREDKLIRLSRTIEEIESCQATLETNAELSGKVKAKLKRIGTMCPTCGNPLKKS